MNSGKQDYPLNEYTSILFYYLKVNYTKMQQQQEIKKPRVIFLLGGPGSGKGTQSDIMIKEYNFIHYSTGDLLREFKNRDCELAKQIRQLMSQGKLCPSPMLVDIIKQNIFADGPNDNIYLLDGFPRNQQNLKSWNQVMKDDVQVKCLINLDCKLETLRQRLIARGKTSGRDDDNIQTIMKRFQTFKSQTQPFVEYYKRNVGHIYTLEGQNSVEDVSSMIRQTLKTEGLI